MFVYREKRKNTFGRIYWLTFVNNPGHRFCNINTNTIMAIEKSVEFSWPWILIADQFQSIYTSNKLKMQIGNIIVEKKLFQSIIHTYNTVTILYVLDDLIMKLFSNIQIFSLKIYKKIKFYYNPLFLLLFQWKLCGNIQTIVTTGVRISSSSIGETDAQFWIEWKALFVVWPKKHCLRTMTRNSKGRRPRSYPVVWVKLLPNAKIFFLGLDPLFDDCRFPTFTCRKSAFIAVKPVRWNGKIKVVRFGLCFLF